MEKTYVGLKAQGMGFDAHLTVHYCGNLTSTQERYIRFLLNEWDGPREFTVVPSHIKMFGKNDFPVPVVVVSRFTTDPENSGRSLIDLNNFLHDNFPSPSKFRWEPHITLKIPFRQDLHIPHEIRLTELDLY